MAGDPIDPGIKARFETKAIQGPVGFQEGLLENFSRLFAISKHMEGKPENLPVMPSNELFESHAIAALRLLYQELLFVGIVCSLFGPSQDCFHDYGR